MMPTVMEMIEKRSWMQDLDEESLLSAQEVLNFLEANNLVLPAIFGGESMEEDYGLLWSMEWTQFDTHGSITSLEKGGAESETKYECFYMKLNEGNTEERATSFSLDTNDLSEALAFIKEHVSSDTLAKEK
jgi:hypothetical protein